ncbi:MAG: glycosyltransferase WbuB [Verrucomicrobiales bacterium]|nr:glycosyltransferase WbuB [Verrucomicrobiales bacterium]
MRLLVHDYAGHPFQIQLSRELAKMGHEVLHAFAGSLQTPRGDLVKGPTDAASFSVTEVAMDADYTKYKYNFLRRRNMEVAYGKQVAKLIKSWKPDGVISSNTPTEAQEPILRATQELNARFVYWLQDFYSLAVDKLVRKKIPVLGALIGLYYRRMEGRQLRASHRVVAITEDFAPILQEEFAVPASRITAIPNWAPLETLPVCEKDNEWSRSHGLHDKFVYLYTGTLGMKHNPELLLGLAEKFRAQDRVRVVVISEGIGAEWLASQKAAKHLDNLILLPYQDFSAMPRVLASGDVLCAVLEEDAGVFSVPSKVLTYLCAARPLLLAVPQVNLAARIIHQHKAGLTVPPADVPAFLEAAEQLLANPHLAARCAQKAREYAKNTFKIEEIAVKFANIFTN